MSFFCLFSFFFFSFLLIHGMPSFHVKPLHLGICRHFSNPAMVYSTRRSDRQLKTGATKVLMTPTHLTILTREPRLLLPLFGDTRRFAVWQNSFSLICLLCLRAELFGSPDGITRQKYNALGKCHFQLTFNTIESRWVLRIPKWLSDFSLSHSMPFLPTCQMQTN